ncbi:MAG: hypothetical protein A2X94_01980 [Bdellovibrionales bacterium GWB1_55_8]|nr:MAG: hypothetical protein A2X94_01980 [Bdellovibrionales bacterium GWB1_55_8]
MPKARAVALSGSRREIMLGGTFACGNTFKACGHCSSTLIATSFTGSPPNCEAAATQRGISSRHGGHQLAQKWIKTTFPRKFSRPWLFPAESFNSKRGADAPLAGAGARSQAENARKTAPHTITAVVKRLKMAARRAIPKKVSIMHCYHKILDSSSADQPNPWRFRLMKQTLRPQKIA